MAAVGYAQTGDLSRVAKAGDTMSGLLVLSADPVVPLGAATKEYVDAGGSAGAQPGNTVVTETSYGQGSTAGASALYSRTDHTHGTPAALTSLPPSGAASGDLGGSYPAPTVVATHLAAPLPLAQGGTGQSTASSAVTALTGTQTAGFYLRSDGTNSALAAIQAADVPTLNQNTTGTASNVTGVVAISNGGTGSSAQTFLVLGGDVAGGSVTAPQVTSTHLSAPLPLAQGGTGQSTASSAITALTGVQTSGRYLRSDGTNAALAAIQVADVPTLNQNTTGTASNVTGIVALTNGGTGSSAQQTAINNLTGAQTSGYYLRSNGVNAALGPIQAADVPTLNQNTTGTASNVTGVVAIANGGTGSSAQTFLNLAGDITGGSVTAPQVTGTHLSAPLPIAQGGSGKSTASSAITALTGSQTSGFYLRSDGTNAALAAIQVADVPTLNQNTSGTASNVTGIVAIANGGSGKSTASSAITALTGSQTSGFYLRSDGTNSVLAALAAADITGVLAVANGGTGKSTASSAITALTGSQTSGFYLRSDGTNSVLAALAAADMTGVLGISNGGTGSSAQNFVDLTNIQTANGTKTWSSAATFSSTVDVVGHMGPWTPRENGLIAATGDPITCLSSATVVVGGTIYLSALQVNRTATPTKLYWGIQNAGVSATSGQNFVAFVDTAGTVVQSIGVDAKVTTTGLMTETISPGSINPGTYRVAFLFNAGTLPALYRHQGLSAALVNVGLSASSFRHAVNGTSQTALPGSFTLSSNASSSFALFAAIGP